ncbi:MAG: hypothetical protein ABIR66_01690 [Saprospiraceae bacterium]
MKLSIDFRRIDLIAHILLWRSVLLFNKPGDVSIDAPLLCSL